MVGPTIVFPGRIVRVALRIYELGEVEVESSMLHAEGEGVFDHLDLKALFGSGGWIGFVVTGIGGIGEMRKTEKGEKEVKVRGSRFTVHRRLG